MSKPAFETRLSIALAAIIFIVAVIFGVGKFMPEPSSARPSQILEPALRAPGAKKYFAYKKKDLVKKSSGAVRSMSAAFSAFGAKNMKELDMINGYTFESDQPIDTNKIKSMSVGADEWVIQEDYVHSILPFSCSRCETIPCPGTPTPIPEPIPTEADASWGRTRMHAKEALAKIDTSKVKVCVVDTGIDLSHPNRGNVVASRDFTGKGSAQDGNGHGTHTAGTVAGKGGVGISKAALYICKGLDDGGSGSSSSLTQCEVWCDQQKVNISSNSWGSPQQDPAINQVLNTLTSHGIAVVVANGNDSQGRLNWPAALGITNPMVFGIAASDQSDRKASFSTYGTGTKYIAPGVRITSNWPGGITRDLDGTSMATPHVAGAMTYCYALGLPPTCLKTDNLGLPSTVQGAGLPRLDLL